MTCRQSLPTPLRYGLLEHAAGRTHTSSLLCWTWFTSLRGILKAGLDPTVNTIVAVSTAALPQFQPDMLTSCSCPQAVLTMRSCGQPLELQLTLQTGVRSLCTATTCREPFE